MLREDWSMRRAAEKRARAVGPILPGQRVQRLVNGQNRLIAVIGGEVDVFQVDTFQAATVH